MVKAYRSIGSVLFGVTIAYAGNTLAAETGVTGQGSFRPPNAPITVPADSPFSAADLSSGRISFVIRWDTAAADRDPNLYRGSYAGAIKQFTVRIGATEIELAVNGAVIEVSDGGDVSHREFVKLQASQVLGAHTIKVGFMSLNEITKTGDLRGSAGRLAGDGLPNGEQLVAFQPTGRFDRGFFVTMNKNAEPRSFPIYLQTSDIEITSATTATVGAAR